MGVITYILSILALFVLNTTSWSLGNFVLAGPRVGRATLGTIDTGLRKALEECQAQFKWDRWNCPESDFDIFTKRGKLPATREMAFVHAIMSAGITHTITRNCSRGTVQTCKCGTQPRKVNQAGDWTWGGCNDNIRVGDRVSRRFLLDKTTTKSRDLYAVMYRHNHRVGRSAVRKSMKQTCKCHGVSGSCSEKTCWMQLAEMSTVGTRLRRAYERARLAISNRGDPPETEHNRVLLFASPSDDFCRPDRSRGSNGTYGRQCSRRTGRNVSKRERHSCRNLCQECGLGLRHEVTTRIHPCNCKFIWCCSVKCDTCATEVQEHFCN